MDLLAQLHQSPFQNGSTSAGSLQPSRCAPFDTANRLTFVWASGSTVSLSSLQRGVLETGSGRKGKKASLVTLPTMLPSLTSLTLAGHTHTKEVQSVCAATGGGGAESAGSGNLTLASIDSVGRAFVSQYVSDGLAGDGSALGAAAWTYGYSLAAPGTPVEPGWAGIALDPANPRRCAVAHHWSRSVAVAEATADGRSATTARFWTAQPPVAVAWLASAQGAAAGGGGGSSSLVAATDGAYLAVWDVRASSGVPASASAGGAPARPSVARVQVRAC
jgi:hypothetical protein